jgi:hypothetical protein
MRQSTQERERLRALVYGGVRAAATPSPRRRAPGGRDG